MGVQAARHHLCSVKVNSRNKQSQEKSSGPEGNTEGPGTASSEPLLPS